ncbi:BCCT family transporter [Escherichia coli]
MDIAAVIGTIFGIATTLGIGVVQLNYGLSVLFDIPDSMAAKAALIAFVGDNRHDLCHLRCR